MPNIQQKQKNKKKATTRAVDEERLLELRNKESERQIKTKRRKEIGLYMECKTG